MAKWEIRDSNPETGTSDVYENGVKIGTVSKESGIPFISSDQAVVRDSSGRKVGTVSSLDDGIIGGLLGHKKTVVDDLRKSSSQARRPISSSSDSKSGSYSNTPSRSYRSSDSSIGSSIRSLRWRTKLALGAASLFVLGALAIEYVHPHRVYGVFKAADDVVEIVKRPFQESSDPGQLEKKVELTEPKDSERGSLTIKESPTPVILKDGKQLYHPNCVGKETTYEMGEWKDRKSHCQGYALGKWNDARLYREIEESCYFCWNPAPNGTSCGKNKVCLEGLCHTTSP
jgi:hypothetical protein